MEVFFNDIGDTLKRGWDFVKDKAGDVIEVAKQIIPNEAVKAGLTAGATALGTMVGTRKNE